MPAGRLKSGRYRQFRVRTTKHNVMHKAQRLPKVPHCAECGAALKGIPRMTAARQANSGKSKKRPQRSFGGVLCSKCARRKLIKDARL